MTSDDKQIKLDERNHVEKPLLDQLAGLGWGILDLDGKQHAGASHRTSFTAFRYTQLISRTEWMACWLLHLPPVGEGNHNKSSGSILSFDLFANLKLFELRLGVPENFYRDLLHEDDWSFVIKLNALFEAACTHILATRMHAPALEESLAHLDLLHSKYGKVALLRKLGALTSEQGTVLRNLAELRNSLAHNIHNVAFSFEKYVAGLDKQQLDNLIRNFGHGVADELRIGDKTIQRRQFIHENPKIALWLTSMEILGCLAIEVEVARLHVKSLALSEFANLHGAQPRSLRSLDSQKLRARQWVG